MMMQARFELLTPTFSAGSDQAAPEIRLPSLKGLIRYWWRALAWSRFAGNLQTIKDHEDTLFGSASKGRGSFSIRWSKRPAIREFELEDDAFVSSPALAYLAGQGLWDQRAQRLQRPGIAAGCTFEVSFRLRTPDSDSGEVSTPEQLREAIIAMSVFGGVGARTRRGFGSLHLSELAGDEIDRWEAPKSSDDLASVICDLTAAGRDARPPYTAFSRDSRFVLAIRKGNASQAHEAIGKELIRYRSYGASAMGGQTSLGEPGARLFAGDHDLIRDYIQTGKLEALPQRIAFGLPHNYFFSGGLGSVTIAPRGNRRDGRRASPLFVRVHRLGESHAVLLAFLPADFLPGRTEVQVRHNARRQRPRSLKVLTEREFWSPIERFLDLLSDGPEQGTDRVEFETVVKIR